MHPFYAKHTSGKSERKRIETQKPPSSFSLFFVFGFCCNEIPSYQGNILNINSKCKIYLDVAIFQTQWFSSYVSSHETNCCVCLLFKGVPLHDEMIISSLHPWNPQNGGLWKMFLFKRVMFRFQVPSFWGSIKLQVGQRWCFHGIQGAHPPNATHPKK